jgi:hypothetical protein
MKVFIFFVILPGVNTFVQDYDYVIEDTSVTSSTNALEAKKSVDKFVFKDMLPVPKPGATLRPVLASTTAKPKPFSTTSTLLPVLFDHRTRMTKSSPEDFASESESSK